MMLALESDEVKVGGPIPDEKVKLINQLTSLLPPPLPPFIYAWDGVQCIFIHLNMHCKFKGVVLTLSSNFRPFSRRVIFTQLKSYFD